MQATASACLFLFASLFHFTFITMFSASPRSSVEAFLCVTAYHERRSLFSASQRSSVEAFVHFFLSHVCTFSRYLTVAACFDSDVTCYSRWKLRSDYIECIFIVDVISRLVQTAI